MTTVADAFNITDFEIQKLADTKNPYWETVRDFWWQKKEDDVSSLSPKQAAWLSKIEEDLDMNWRPKWMEEEGADDFYA